MPEEQITQQTTQVEETIKGDNQEYLDAIKKLQENTVSKEEYEKLKKNNSNLLKAVLDGNGNQPAKQEDKKRSNDELRKIIFSEDGCSNLEFIEASLELRENILEEEGKDIFLPYGKQISPDEDDVKASERVVKVFKECVEYANGDSDIFTNELQRRTIDVMPIATKKRN